MRRFIFDLILLCITIVLVYFFLPTILQGANRLISQTFPCSQPIAYSIGTFDKRFGISEATFLKDIQQSESVWEKPAGKELFVYKPDGALKINLIFDDRQLATQKLQKMGITIHDDTASYDKLKGQYNTLKTTIAQAKANYQVQLNTYNTRLAAYNTEVTSINQHDHVSQADYDRLAQEKTSLDQLSAQLKDAQNKINANVDELNALVVVINRIAKTLNLAAVTYNTIGASNGSEFEEGEYVSDASGNRINIYQFDDPSKLIRVLMHEMGHALGLGHLENPKAIMYRLNNGVNETLTADDIAALKKQCGVK